MPAHDSRSRRAHSRREAEAEHIVVTLRTYGGVLGRQRLANLCGAAHWSDAGFRLTLADAVSSGQVKPLGDELYELTGSGPQT
jgi:hypothetical protein